MEMTMFFPLLLLICSFSTAQLQTDSDNQIIPHGKQTEPQRREPTIASDPEQDIHAVLREMSASLAEQRVEMRHLQRDNEAQQRELEVQKTEMDKLKQQLKLKQVAFSASLLASGSGYVGPFSYHRTLEFRHVVTNIGGAYNPNTGVFIAPVRGAYHFDFCVGAHRHSSAAWLVKNGEHICMAWEHEKSGYGSSSKGVTLLLQARDVVFVRLEASHRVYDSYNHHSTFSGHLLFTM